MATAGRKEVRVDVTGTLTLTPAEAARELRISRSKCYELLAAGELPSIRVGASRRVPRRALQEWIDRGLAMRASER
jgi:excisionase family DNA binding protein